MLRAAELLSEQLPIPPSSQQLVRQRGHVNKKPSSVVEGADAGQGKARRETSVIRVFLSSSEKIPAENQSSSTDQHAPPYALLTVSLQWQGGDGGKILLGWGFLSAI